MTARCRLRVLGIVIALAAAGCGGYFPLRWPNRALWAPTVAERQAVELPNRPAEDFPIRETSDQVTVAMDPMSAEAAERLFGINLLARNIQPILIHVANSADQAYLLSRANLSAPTLSAAEAAHALRPSAGRSLASHIRWVTFFLPGLAFYSVVEPLTTFDFPGIQEAASRPAVFQTDVLAQEFAKVELPEGSFGKYRRQTGVWFARPLRIGDPLVLTLVNETTQKPLIFAFQVPRESQPHIYAHPFDKVWEATLEVANSRPAWRIVSADPAKGTISVEQGQRFFAWGPQELLITVKRLEDAKTQVSAQQLDKDKVESAMKLTSVVDLFSELSGRLPTRLPKPKAAPGKTAKQEPKV